jgi:hypothetical protein
MVSIAELSIKLDLSKIIKLSKPMSYIYNKNTHLKSPYTTIYVPRYYKITERQITNYIKGNLTKGQDLLKAQEIFLSKTNLEKFIKNRKIKRSSTTNNKIIKENSELIVNLFFRKDTIIQISGKTYTVTSTQLTPTCSYNIVTTPKLRKELQLKKLTEITKENNDLMKNYKLDSAQKKLLEKQIQDNIKREYDAFMSSTAEQDAYINKYLSSIENKTKYTCTVSLNLVLKTKPKTLKERRAEMKKFITNYRTKSCKNKSISLKRRKNAICRDYKYYNPRYPTSEISSLIQVMCETRDPNWSKNPITRRQNRIARRTAVTRRAASHWRAAVGRRAKAMNKQMMEAEQAARVQAQAEARAQAQAEARAQAEAEAAGRVREVDAAQAVAATQQAIREARQQRDREKETQIALAQDRLDVAGYNDWRPLWDPRYQRIFYINDRTKESQWEFPDQA